MISYEQAKKLALEQARKTFFRTSDIVLREDNSIEVELGWVFDYNTKRFLDTGDFEKMLWGNNPIFVEKKTGRVSFIRGDIPIEEALQEWREEINSD